MANFPLRSKLPGVAGHSWLVWCQFSLQGLSRGSNILRLGEGRISTRMFEGLRSSRNFMLSAFCETSGVYVLQPLLMKSVSSLAATEGVLSQ